MKKIVMVLIILALSGCVPHFTIPDKPTFEQFSIIPLEGGVCMEDSDFVIFTSNVDKMWNYAGELRKLLEEIQSGVKSVEIYSEGDIARNQIK
ncbi:MAG: hypothetical protein ABIH34_03935 [Nanoarchaeota archaeon]